MSLEIYITVFAIDLSRIPVNKGIKSRLGWTKYSDLYEIVHPSLDLIFLCLFTGAECGKGLLQSSGSFSNEDGDGNEDVKKEIGLLSKTTTLHVHHAFSYISLPSLHDYEVKMPKDVNKPRRVFHSLCKLERGP